MMKSVRSTIVIMTITIFAWLSLGSCGREPQTQTPDQTTEESTPSQIWLWSAIILIPVLEFVLFSNLRDRANHPRSGIGENQDQSPAPGTAAKTSETPDNETLTQKVLDLEKQVVSKCETLTQKVLDLEKQVRQPMVVHNEPNVATSPETNGYFGNPVQAAEPYFKKLLYSYDSEVRFSVEISDDKAVFRPLESSAYIGTFISNDAMRAAIEFQGYTPGEQPSSMSVISPGEAEKKDNKWFIKKKSQVKLSK